MALAQQHAKQHVRLRQPAALQGIEEGAFRDIVPTNPPQAVALPLGDGTNAAVTFDYSALSIKTGAGWDSVTGLGVPNGKAFISAIK